MFTTTDQHEIIMDSINAFDMSIYQELQKQTYDSSSDMKRDRSMSIMSDMSDDISHIPPKTAQEEKEEEEETCCICYEPMNIKKNYCVTPCGHAFCFICIVKTMSKQNSCPCCRASLYQEEHIQSVVIEDYDEQSVMNASLSSNMMIVQNENQYLEDVFPHLSDRLQPRNLQNAFDDVGDAFHADGDHSLNDMFISALMPDDMEIATDISVSLPTYISQESHYHLEQWPPQTESERQRYPDSSDIPPETEETEEFINISDILPPSMDNIPKFGDNMILSLHARMRSEGYTMLDVLMITLMKMYPEEIRQDLASYQCARGLNTIIQELQNETKEKELFAMEDRDVVVM